MFIPKGKTVHENLATSYVLVDALVADLREGGFSGVVEVVLRHTTGYVLFDGGKVAAVAETGEGGDYTKSSVAELASKSRNERGRVSVFAYAEPVAKAVASLLHAQPLYTRLSSEFADLQKMAAKFMREGDRHWFIKVQAETNTSLVFISDGKCIVVTASLITSDGPPEKLETLNRLALEELIDRCHRSPAIFDVYFRSPYEQIEEAAENAPAPAPLPVSTANSQSSSTSSAAPVSPPPPQSPSAQSPPEDAPASANIDARLTVEQLQTMARQEEERAQVDAPPPLHIEIAPPLKEAEEAQEAAETIETAEEILELETETPLPETAESHNEAEALPEEDSPLAAAEEEAEEEVDKAAAAGVGQDAVITSPPFVIETPGDIERPERVLPTRELLAMAGTDEKSYEDFRMAEVRRLLSDIARGIEEITRIVEQRDDFPMHLRAGQLKVTNQYPFLDPFGSDFEYLEGEIVFVGKTSIHEFIVGVTEALRFAVTNAVQVSINPPRLRSEIIRKLKFLYERNREEFNQHGLDLSIEQIAGVQMTA